MEGYVLTTHSTHFNNYLAWDIDSKRENMLPLLDVLLFPINSTIPRRPYTYSTKGLSALLLMLELKHRGENRKQKNKYGYAQQAVCARD